MIRIRFLAMIAMIGVALGPRFAAAQLGQFLDGDVLFAGDLNVIVDQVNNNTTGLNALVDQVNNNTAVLSGIPPRPTVTVNCDAGETIMAKLDQAQRGTRIEITGTCREAVVIPVRGLVLEGAPLGNAIIEGGSLAGILIERKSVVLENLTIQNSNHGIIGVDGARIEMLGVTVKNNTLDGILIENNSLLRATGCDILNNSGDGIAAESNSSIDLHSPPPPANGTGCTISGNGGDGISASGSSNVSIGNSTISGNDEQGLSVDGSSNAIVQNSTISGNGVDTNLKGSGLLVQGGSRAEIDNSSITGNMTDGVTVKNSSTVEIHNTTITSNANIGVFVENSSSGTIEGTSTITGNTLGPNLKALFGSFLTVSIDPVNFGNSLFCLDKSSARDGRTGNILTAFSGCF